MCNSKNLSLALQSDADDISFILGREITPAQLADALKATLFVKEVEHIKDTPISAATVASKLRPEVDIDYVLILTGESNDEIISKHSDELIEIICKDPRFTFGDIEKAIEMYHKE